MRFDLKSGEPKCITEEIKGNALTVGNYSVVNPIEGYPLPDSYKITVRVCLWILIIQPKFGNFLGSYCMYLNLKFGIFFFFN
jgi:hypothetical protein